MIFLPIYHSSGENQRNKKGNKNFIPFSYLYISYPLIYHLILLQILNILFNTFCFIFNPMAHSQPIKPNFSTQYILTDFVVGKGGLGQVFKGYNPNSGQQLAFKEMLNNTQKASLSKEFYDREVKALKKLNGCKNVLKFYGEYFREGHSFIVTELCKGGNLSKYIKNNKICHKKAVFIMRQIILGYLSIYENKIIHRDLKPSNILLTQQIQIKIADFGFALDLAEAENSCSLKVGSTTYMAPQVIKKNKYSCYSDIWSLGLIFFQLEYGQKPWKQPNQNRLYQIQNKHCRGDRHFANNLEGFCQSFLKKTLCFEATKRSKPHQLLQLLNIELESADPCQYFLNLNAQTIKKEISITIGICSLIENLLDLIRCLRQFHPDIIHKSIWDHFTQYLLDYFQNNMQKVRTLYPQKCGKQQKLKSTVSTNDRHSCKGQKVFDEFLGWLGQNVTTKSCFDLFLLYDYLVTLRWLQLIQKEEYAKSEVNIQSIVKSLVYNLEKDNSQKKIANKDLNLLKYKVESLQKNY